MPATASCLHFIWGVGDGQPLPGHWRLDCDLRQVVWVAQLCGEVELEVLHRGNHQPNYKGWWRSFPQLEVGL